MRFWCVLLISVVALNGTHAQRDVATQGLHVWLVTPEGRVPFEKTAGRYLSRPVAYSCTRKPLWQVVDDLGQFAPLTLDRAALKSVGLTVNMSTTLSQGKTLSDSLHELCDSYGLSLTVGTRTLEITGESDADQHEQTMVYDVTDLVAYQGKPVRADWLDDVGLKQLICTMVAPDTWPVGNFTWDRSIEKDRVYFSIPQTSRVHLEIMSLLRSLLTVANGQRRRLDFVPPSAKECEGKELTQWRVKPMTRESKGPVTILYDVTGHFADERSAQSFVTKLVVDTEKGTESIVNSFTLGGKSVVVIKGSEAVHQRVCRSVFPSGSEARAGR